MDEERAFVEAKSPKNAVWAAILGHAGAGHEIHIDLYDSKEDLVEDADRAVNASLQCFSHDDLEFIAEIEKP